ncbi:MAG: methyltransferase domain-containing protein [bacterium]|nr:methyltransferase domain-containing protein [bacterium]
MHWIPPRRTGSELLDQGAGTLDDVRASLNDMWRLNRVTGGLDAFMRLLVPRLAAPGTAALHVADLGAGSGRLAGYVRAWACRRGKPMRVYALDLSARNLKIAQEIAQRGYATHTTAPPLALIQADALALPFAPSAIDYYISTLILHHFEPDALIALLRHTFERAGRGIVMSDITRGALAHIGFRAVQPFAGPHPITRHDGLVSLRRAYTPDELRAFAHAAGLAGARVIVHPLWRMTLIADKTQ